MVLQCHRLLRIPLIWRKTRTFSHHKVNIMAADDLMLHEARASAAIVLPQFSFPQSIPATASKGLMQWKPWWFHLQATKCIVLDSRQCSRKSSDMSDISDGYPQMSDFTNLNKIYKAHRTNVRWTMEVFRLHCSRSTTFILYHNLYW